MVDREGLREAFYNVGKACQPYVAEFAAIGNRIKQLNERPDFQLLVISIKSRGQENPYRFILGQLVVRFVKSKREDKRYWLQLLLACIRERKHLKLCFSLNKLGVIGLR